MTQVFISYSRKDLDFVEQLAADLKKAGFDVWYDVSGIRGGSRWRFEIENALRKSQFAIFVLSPDMILSEWVEREFLFSSNLKLGLLPLMYRACELPLSYLNLNYIDVQGENYRRNFHQILNALGAPQASLPSPEKVISTPPAPSLPPPKKRNASPIIFGLAILVVGFMICAALLVRGYFSLLTQSVTETLPVAHSTFTPTSVDPVNPTSPPVVLPSDTPLPSPSAEFWVSYDSNPNGNRDIFLLNPVTGEQQGVITDPSHDKVGTWSPDGKLLAFESNRGNSNFYQIYLFDSEQGSTTKLTDFIDCSNFAPTWSPDGNKIVFYSTCENSQRDIYIMNRDGTGRKNLSSSSGEDKFPVFSPDGSLIAFTSTRNAKNQIFLMNADGSNQRYIADGCSSSFSPDGNSLWFSSSTACEDGNITHVQINGANLATVGTVTGRNPAVSPDGRVVVFQSNDDLWIVDVDGSNLQQLTSGSTEDGAPSWKP